LKGRITRKKAKIKAKGLVGVGPSGRGEVAKEQREEDPR
jgi:hypothetical protein